MRLKPLAGLFFCALFSATPAFAWNATGHEVVAKIAWDNLTPQAKARITDILKQHPDYARALMKETTPAGEQRDKEAFLVAATWPDLIRSTTFGKSHATYHHPIWHYIDYPYTLGNVKAAEEADPNWKPGADPQNAVQAIKKCVAEIRDPATSPADRAVALAWIEHLVGDIHQPLHAVSMYSDRFPQGDKGGNSQIVKGDGRVSNLHSIWDGLFGGFVEVAAIDGIAQQVEKDHPRSEFQKELTISDPDQWARMSHDQAVHSAYLDGKLQSATYEQQKADKSTPVPELPAGYLDNAKALAARNGALAGYRLADALNRLFGN